MGKNNQKIFLAIWIFFEAAQIASADMIMPPTICHDHNWVEITATRNDPNRNTPYHYRNHPAYFCVLPNGTHYNLFTLEHNKNSEYKELIKQYSGKQPTKKQINEAIKKIEADDYHIDHVSINIKE